MTSFIRVLSGCTRPLLVMARDDDGEECEVVLKLQKPIGPAQGATKPAMLAVELACAMIARKLGLPVPDYAIVTVGDEYKSGGFVRHPDAKAALMANLGRHFGSIYEEGMQLGLPLTRSNGLADILEEIITLDASIINPDRSTANPNTITNGKDLKIIDNGFAMRRALNGNPIANHYLTETEIKNHCAFTLLHRQARPFREIIYRWGNLITNAEVDMIDRAIPKSWRAPATEVDALLDFIRARPRNQVNISLGLRKVVQ